MEFSKRFDVYSLAACLYKALTNEDPTDCEDRFYKSKRKEQDLIPPRKYNPKIKRDVEDAILKGMALKREEIPSMEKWLYELPKPLHWHWQQVLKAKRRLVNLLHNLFR